MRVFNQTGPFICDICGRKYLSRSSFISHYFKYHKTDLFCDFCPNTFSKKVVLIDHIQKIHLKLRKFNCEICDFKSFYKQGLNKHMLSHGVKTECPICHKFVLNLSSHSRIHFKVKCPISDKIFVKKYLSSHMKAHNPQPKRKAKPTFYCDLCYRSFNLKYRLMYHLKTFHLKLRPFECKTCNHKSFNRRDFKCHMMTHGPKIECEICHSVVSNIAAHLKKIHEKVECPICKKTCPKAYLSYHLKQNHK